MTDTERSRIEAICKTANVDDIGNLSDGFHTFNQLYYQRMMLFAVIVKQNKDKAWKSKRHEDGELCFGGGWFVVGITTPEGEYTYHYEEKDWDIFDCMELPTAPHWDGHTEKDVTRLLSLGCGGYAHAYMQGRINGINECTRKLRALNERLGMNLAKGWRGEEAESEET